MTNFIQRWLGAQSGALGIARRFALKCAWPGGVLCGPGGVKRGRVALWLAMALLATVPAWAADTLNWETNQNRVSADIKEGKLIPLLEHIASATGWQVFLEPGTTCAVSAKFDRLPPGEALHLLLRDLNFALVPATNASAKLFVFRSSMENATQSVRPANPAGAGSKGKLIPNELIVRLKPGAKIDDLAKLSGAKVIGHIDSLNAYRLQFEDQAAADAARQQLASNPDVASVDSNYSIDRPATPAGVQGSNLPPPPQLQFKTPPTTGPIIVGLLDTGLQPLGNGLDSFLLPSISVAGDAQLDPNAPSHGTSMAETILRSIATMTQGSSSVQILPVDIYGPNSTTTTFDAANGLSAASQGGARIFSMSFGSAGDSPFLQYAIQQISAAGNVVLIAAAGNTPVTTDFYPAAYSGVMAVTAVDQGQLASYANRGSFVSLGAPGTSIVYYQNQPWMVQGTSASAAFISGVAAGYMDTTHNGASQAQTFLLSNFGVKLGPGH
ncbi:MAG: S8 family peptidase [Limisphaerales bacterium]